MDRFFQAKVFNLGRLANQQILEKYKKEYRGAVAAEFAQERSARRTAEKAAGETLSALEQLQEEFGQTKIKLTAAYDSAFRWNMAAIGSAALLPIIVLIMHFYRF